MDEAHEHERIEDPAANTQMFRAFVEQTDQPDTTTVGRGGFRVLTLLGGLVAFALAVWFLLQL